MNIGVITPVKHLKGVVELLQTKGNIFFLEEGNKSEVRNLLLEKNIDTILCNPNQQTYKIDRESSEQASYLNHWLGGGYSVVKVDDLFKITKGTNAIVARLKEF